jgi:hypothetical protein
MIVADQIKWKRERERGKQLSEARKSAPESHFLADLSSYDQS